MNQKEMQREVEQLRAERRKRANNSVAWTCLVLGAIEGAFWGVKLKEEHDRKVARETRRRTELLETQSQIEELAHASAVLADRAGLSGEEFRGIVATRRKERLEREMSERYGPTS